MNKIDLVKKVAKKTNLSIKDAGNLFDVFINTIADSLKHGEEVNIKGFLRVNVHERQAREGFNPATKKKMTIPAGKTVTLKAGSILKKAVK